jgi:hypothetical protein
VFSRHQVSSAAKRVRPGDGRLLQDFRWWHLLAGRKLFFLRTAGHGGTEIAYAVDVHLSGRQSDDAGYGKAHLFRDGRHYAQSRLPAVFSVEGGRIEVETTLVGLKRMHYVTDGGVEVQLAAHPRSAIGRRLRFDSAYPTASRMIAALSVFMLIIGIGLNGLQVLEPVLNIPPLAERFGSFESPVNLPLWLNVALGVAAGLGSAERALRLRHHWLLDGAGT